MANRQQENRGQQNWRRSSNERYWENDDERWGSDQERERERGRESGAERYADEYDDGRVQYRRRRDTREESGSTGRTAGFAGYGDFGQGDYDNPGRSANTGQGRYGQTGYGQGGYEKGGYGSGGYGQGSYGQSDQGQPDYGAANYSQGRPNYGGGSDYGYGRSGRRDWESGRDDSFGRGRYGYGGSGLRGSGSGYGSGNWYEPYGEGQQYGGERWNREPGQSGQRFGGGQYGGSRYGFGEGPHRGKGPKGYQRSDEWIKEMICERLREDPEIDASDVTVTVQGGRVTLEGTVDHRGTKNAIEDVAEQLGVSDVQNNLRVQRAGQQGMEQQTGRAAMSSSSKTTLGDDGDTSKQKRN